MSGSNIILGKTYFYNNRPVVPIAVEGHNFYKCYVNFSIPTVEIKGKDFCIECMAGVGYSSHTCDDYDHVIEIIGDTLSDEDIMFLPSRYLKDHPFEYYQYKQISDRSASLSHDVSNLNKEKYELSVELKNIDNTIKEKNNEKDLITNEIVSLKQKLSSIKKQIDEASNTVSSITIKDGNIKISMTDFKEIYIDHLKLLDLQSGGVDNWDWYGESIRSSSEYQKEFVESYL